MRLKLRQRRSTQAHSSSAALTAVRVASFLSGTGSATSGPISASLNLASRSARLLKSANSWVPACALQPRSIKQRLTRQKRLVQ